MRSTGNQSEMSPGKGMCVYTNTHTHMCNSTIMETQVKANSSVQP